MKNFNAARFLEEISYKVMSIYNENTASDSILEKENSFRDVVTELDLKIDKVIDEYCKNYSENIIYKSEENDNCLKNYKSIPQLVISDPLDGSKNFQLGIKNYQTLISYLELGIVKASCIINPCDNELLYWSEEFGIRTNKVTQNRNLDGPVYFAYGSMIKTDQDFNNLFKIINTKSAGIYRWGSAGSGLLELYKGKLKGFVGYEIKIWDCLSYIKIFEHIKAYIHVEQSDDKINLVVSYDQDFVKQVKEHL